MFDVKGVDIKIEIPVLEDFNTIKDRYNLISDGMLLMPRLTACGGISLSVALSLRRAVHSLSHFQKQIIFNKHIYVFNTFITRVSGWLNVYIDYMSYFIWFVFGVQQHQTTAD